MKVNLVLCLALAVSVAEAGRIDSDYSSKIQKDEIAEKLRRVTDLLPGQIVSSTKLNLRLSKVLDLSFYMTDTVLHQQVGLKYPDCYGAFALLFILASYLPF